MKSKFLPVLCRSAAVLLLLSTLHALRSTLFAQGTAFTYQGQLVQNGAPANGFYGFQFRLRQTSNGAQQGPTLTNNSVAVSNGLFVATLDFGTIFGEREFGLEIGVRSNLTLPFTILAPTQVIRPSPLAIAANRAASADTVLLVTDGALSAGTYTSALNFNNSGNSFSGNGAALINVNAAALGGLTSSSFWKTGGNAGTTAGANYFGTADNQPLELKVNGSRAFRVEPGTNGAPNIIGGSAINFAGLGMVGATIGGGGSADYPNSVGGDFGTVSGGLFNQAASPYATVSGGQNNSSIFYGATVSGGAGNTSSSSYTTVAGGAQNICSGSVAAVGGGYYNTASGMGAVVGGGGFDGNTGDNVASGTAATIPGGFTNLASGNYSFAAGQRAKAIHGGAFVWADSQSFDFSSTGNNQFCVRASGGVQLATNTSLFCDQQTRQMLNLWGIKYGIGVQALTTYFRTDNADVNNGFIWYKGGVHNDGYANAGGGIEMMHLVSAGLYVNGTLVSSSDRNVKAGFEGVDPQAMLEKVAALPITRWHYTNDVTTPHLGPMAQDFYAAFNVGSDERHIATVDADGVALAAIQGLNQKVEQEKSQVTELSQRLRAKEMEITELKQRLQKLERLMTASSTAGQTGNQQQ